MLVSGRDPTIPYELDEGYVATFSRLRNSFRARGLSAEESADLAQDTIARALLHLRRNGTRPEMECVGPLLKRISTNLLIDRARAQRLRLVPIESAEADPLEADVSEEVERKHQTQEVHAAIASLSERHQRAMLMALGGKSPAEIAEDFGIERNAADALLHRARRRLADRLRGGMHAVRVAVLLGLVKLRDGGRRSGAGGVAPATMNIAAAVMATIATVAAPAVTSAEVPRVDTRPVSVQHDLNVGTDFATGSAVSTSTVPTGSSNGGDGGSGSGITIDPRDHRVGASAGARNPATGEDEEVLVDVWHQREEDRGHAGPLLDQASETVCQPTVAVC